ncbi:MAG TPA: phosphoribosylanthranilate isomerase [Burkholderiaceae bacterium]|nr:phosphoribosylanthranilate isomerase [Burkholderiaceae bacterium]
MIAPADIAGRVKVCGLRSAEEARACIEAGVDLVGLVFAPGSRRRLDIAQARAVREAIGGRAEVVGVFMDQTRHEVEQYASALRLDRLQLHGGEDCHAFLDIGLPLIKRLPPRVARPQSWPPRVWLLLDPGAGSGAAFDWEADGGVDARGAMVAGGLSPDNVEHVIRATGAAAVDVSSGVEAVAGHKDPSRIASFCARARAALAPALTEVGA